MNWRQIVDMILEALLVVAFILAGVLFMSSLNGCKPVVADEMQGCAESGDLCVLISGCDYIGKGMIKCAPSIGTDTVNLSFLITAPTKDKLQCDSESCVRVVVRDGNQTVSTKWISANDTEVRFNFKELLGSDKFETRHSMLLNIGVTAFYDGNKQTTFYGEIRLKPIAPGYKFLAPKDKYTAAVWDCFNLFECGLSTKGRTYIVKK